MWQVPILGEIVGLGRDRLKGKQEIKKAKTQAEATVIVNSAQDLADWEKIQAKASESSWKDEFFALVLSIPLILSFFPDMVPYIRGGFQALSETPQWYQYLVGVAVLSSFGIKAGKMWKK